MKIRRISVHKVDLPLREGRYAWSGGKSVDVFDSTVVRVETDDGGRARMLNLDGMCQRLYRFLAATFV